MIFVYNYCSLSDFIFNKKNLYLLKTFSSLNIDMETTKKFKRYNTKKDKLRPTKVINTDSDRVSEKQISNIDLFVKNNIINTKGQVSTGFDKGLDYLPTKQKLINTYNKTTEQLNNLDPEDKVYTRKKKVIVTKLIYQLIAMIQLANGSRISEAVKFFILYLSEDGKNNTLTIKISKSESTKYKNGEEYVTKPRFRKMKMIDWVKLLDLQEYADALVDKDIERLMKRVLDYLRNHFGFNTHSLRYACINYLIYSEKIPLNSVAKYVGHCDLGQITTYTQAKNCEKIFDLTCETNDDLKNI